MALFRKKLAVRGAGKTGALPFFLLAALSAVAAGALAYLALQAAAPTAAVVIAAVEIPAYKPLAAEDLAVVAIPAGAVPAGAISDKSKAVDRYVTRPFLPGDVIREGHLSDYPSPFGPLAAALADRLVGPGRVALSLPGELAPGIVPYLAPGDRLAILGYVPGAAGSEGEQARLWTLAPSATVLRTTVPVDAVGEASIREATIVVAVTEQEALEITRALADGSVALTLLPPARASASKGGMSGE